jgi:hypothetical protein
MPSNSSEAETDYCTWAIQRKWERNDTHSQILLPRKIASEAKVKVPGNEYKTLVS